MSKRSRDVWHCDVCGWEWLPDFNKVPERCPNRECRKRNWNTPAFVQVTQEQLGAHREAMTREPLGGGSICSDCGGLKGLHQKGCKRHKRTP